ncbi:hypothetical protein [Cephaloticoccus primus]|nr:hypothetical protein [Cephaloticoccus primus]
MQLEETLVAVVETLDRVVEKVERRPPLAQGMVAARAALKF